MNIETERTLLTVSEGNELTKNGHALDKFIIIFMCNGGGPLTFLLPFFYFLFSYCISTSQKYNLMTAIASSLVKRTLLITTDMAGKCKGNLINGNVMKMRIWFSM